METFIESVGVEVEYNDEIFLICIYRPPQGNVNNFLHAFYEILSVTKEKAHHEIFILGDLNLNLLQHEDDNIQDLNNLMYSYSLFPLTTLPTRVTATSATLIDHIWSKFVENNVGNNVIKTDITDHFPVVSLFTRKCSISPFPPKFLKKRSITQDALEEFSSALSHIDWSDVINCTCPNRSYNLFHNNIRVVYDNCFPEKTIKINNKINRSPHITSALKRSIKNKHRLKKLAYKWPLTFREQFRAYRNRLTSILKEAKRKYYQDQLLASQGDPKSHWSTIRPGSH